MNVLALFDGISCGQVALEKCGVKVKNYYAAEIDKHAITITQTNYPNTVQLGDITKWREWDIDWGSIDLLTAGFPCQAWSVAGKQEGDNDPRGALVHDLIDIWNHIKELNPNLKFLFENVKMKTEFMLYINNLFGVEPILINSSLVSAQNRSRYYWTNIGTEKRDLFGVNGVHTEQPEDKGIVLEDIIEDGVVDRDKSYGIDANYFKGGNLKSYFQKSRRQLVFSGEGLCHVADADIKGHDYNRRIYSTQGKAPTLTAATGGNLEPKILCGAWRGRHVVDGKRQDAKMATAGKTQQRLEVRQDGKTNALTTVQKDNNVVDINNLEWRKLTPIECERLQTLPDGFTSHVSNTQRYKCIGNGWTVDVIAHIFKGLK